MKGRDVLELSLKGQTISFSLVVLNLTGHKKCILFFLYYSVGHRKRIGCNTSHIDILSKDTDDLSSSLSFGLSHDRPG